MIPSRLEDPALESTALRDKALNLREAVNSSRARMSAQNEQMERLRAQIASLRALVENPALTAAAKAPAFAAPILKEAVAESAPQAVSFKTGARPWLTVPYAAILGVALAVQLRPAPKHPGGIPLADAVAAVPAPLEPAAAPIPAAKDDDGANEALLLVHEWRLPGDERALAERLDPGLGLPGTQTAWSVERTGESAYRVSFRSDADAPSYDFDVELNSKRVDPTPDTAELIAPQLASRR